MKKVTVGIVGAGRATELHMNGYKRVYGVDVRLKSIFSKTKAKADAACCIYGIEKVVDSYEELLKDNEIDVIDICSPPYTHKDMIIKALDAGKHVICEKPLTGFFGDGNIDKDVMYEQVCKDLDQIERALKKSGKLFMYAENFIYAPAIEKAAEIIKSKGSKILFAKGEESLAGSSSPVAGEWSKNGGGSLMRVGSHPLAAIIWLKKQENPEVKVTNINSDITRVTDKLSEYEHRHIKAKPKDVEDTAIVTLTFSDGMKATIIACDTRLGGSKNYVELYCNDTTIECNLTMHNAMSTYLLDEVGMENVEISEMLATKCGWNNPFISDEILRGYVNEIQDFMECVVSGKQARSDFSIALNTNKLTYLAYKVGDKGENANKICY